MLLRTLRSASAVTAGFAVAGAFVYTASAKPAEAESKKVKLTYFDIPGRAVSFIRGDSALSLSRVSQLTSCDSLSFVLH